MRTAIILVLVLLYILTSTYLYKTYSENEKLSVKLPEMIFAETLGCIILGLYLLRPDRGYSLYKILDILQWISFFCMIFFMFYYDYGKPEKETDKELTGKLAIFWHFVKKSGTSNLVLSRNRKFIFFLLLYVVLEAGKLIISRL